MIGVYITVAIISCILLAALSLWRAARLARSEGRLARIESVLDDLYYIGSVTGRSEVRELDCGASAHRKLLKVIRVIEENTND